MKNQVFYNQLYDYYGSLLTSTQKKYFEDYYFNNLSLTEIAENLRISRNAVSKTLGQAIKKLEYYEANLQLWENKVQISKIVNADILEKITKYI